MFFMFVLSSVIPQGFVCFSSNGSYGVSWAQANRDVHRVDVMMSLMHFLHVNDNNTSSMTVASQLSIPHRSQQTTDSSSSSRSHTQAIRGFPQHSHHP